MPWFARGIRYQENASKVRAGEERICGIKGKKFKVPQVPSLDVGQVWKFNCPHCGNILISAWCNSMDGWGVIYHSSICQKEGGNGGE